MDRAGLDQLGAELRQLTSEMGLLVKQINSGRGSAGKLIYSDSLYESLKVLVIDLDSLIKDLEEHPEDYVNFSVFGRSSRKK